MLMTNTSRFYLAPEDIQMEALSLVEDGSLILISLSLTMYHRKVILNNITIGYT